MKIILTDEIKKKKKNGGKTPIKKKKQNQEEKQNTKYAQYASWLSFQKYSELSIGLINLTSIPPLGYPTYNMESNKWGQIYNRSTDRVRIRNIFCYSDKSSIRESIFDGMEECGACSLC